VIVTIAAAATIVINCPKFNLSAFFANKSDQFFRNKNRDLKGQVDTSFSSTFKMIIQPLGSSSLFFYKLIQFLIFLTSSPQMFSKDETNRLLLLMLD